MDFELDQTCKKSQSGATWSFSFFCMAGTCEVLCETADEIEFDQLSKNIFNETKRIEAKYSRYRDDNVIFEINNSGQKRLKLDAETSSLLDFSYKCFELSKGKFDITTGFLRKLWTFDGSKNIPTKGQIKEAIEYIGMGKLLWNKPFLRVPQAMELDFGGFAKEYAVDRGLEMAKSITNAPVLINFGGDLCVSGPRKSGQPWSVGIEGHEKNIELKSGAIATSGDKNRYVMCNGKKLTHILNPITGWPVEGAASSVTVFGKNCTEAGLMSTLAILQGDNAEAFLAEEAELFWVYR